MEFIAKKSDVSSHKTQCAVVFCDDKKLLDSIKLLDEPTQKSIKYQIKCGALPSKLGSAIWITGPFEEKAKYERLLLVNLCCENKDSKSKKDEFTIEHLRTLSSKISDAIHKSEVSQVAIYLDSFIETYKTDLNVEDIAHEFAIALISKQYSFALPSKKKTKSKSLKKVSLVTATSHQLKAAKAGLLSGEAFGAGINSARNLGDLPGNICTPSYLAQEAKKFTSQSNKVSVKILGEKQMEKLGMHSFLSVSKGSVEEGKLICIEYKGKSGSKSPHVLVGKGITFDTGGISLKPGSGMDEMKYDMCGAASVIGVFQALINMDAKVHVVGIIAAAENMPNGNASKPGDIVTSMSGQTIEILNTDAEGRLVLCDALTYAERYKPKSVIDIATLTGACVVALGKHASALYSNDESLAQALKNSSQKTHDRVWEMPLWDDYQQQLNSNFADMANIGGPGGGSITAACFLSRFAKKYHWAHLDIAGTAWLSGANKGATGRPVSLLTHYLLNN